LYLFKPQAGRCLERENMSDGVRLAVFATIAESHGFNPWECVKLSKGYRDRPLLPERTIALHADPLGTAAGEDAHDLTGVGGG
jgi:hypothetical protein